VDAKLVKSGNLDSFYNYVNHIRIGSNGISSLRDEQGNLLTANAEKAEYTTTVFVVYLQVISYYVIDFSRLTEKVPII